MNLYIPYIHIYMKMTACSDVKDNEIFNSFTPES